LEIVLIKKKILKVKVADEDLEDVFVEVAEEAVQ
jgi:hypothetical protein